MQFVPGWSLVQVLGEGAFGEVKLIVNDETQEALAVKVLNTGSSKETQLDVRKELAVHKALTHPNIVKYYGHRREAGFDYIFLEYASGGELFDRIEPDVGMEVSLARRYFLELVSAVEYLHGKGVTHRDIKPENVLLSGDDHVKLSDYGMATMFRRPDGAERLLEKKCGTMPYVAPEVLLRPYSAPAADVWSCGVTLVAMLAGELPWDSPTHNCLEFASWRDGQTTLSPWNRLETAVLSLLRVVLSPQAEKRPKAKEISGYRWCKAEEDTSERPAKRLKPAVVSLTQPQALRDLDTSDQSDANFSFSQPTNLDNLLLSSQLQLTQMACAPAYEQLVRRMTRLWVKLDQENARKKLAEVLEDVGCVVRGGETLSVSGTDRRKMQYTFRVVVLLMNEEVMLDFQLTKGDGLEFKKLFLTVKAELGDVVLKKKVPWV